MKITEFDKLRNKQVSECREKISRIFIYEKDWCIKVATKCHCSTQLVYMVTSGDASDRKGIFNEINILFDQIFKNATIKTKVINGISYVSSEDMKDRGYKIFPLASLNQRNIPIFIDGVMTELLIPVTDIDINFKK